MRRMTQFVILGLIALIFLLSGCGGSSTMMSPVPTPPQSAQLSLSVMDAPPTGVTVLSFEVSVTGAALNPGNVNLLAGKGPVRIEVKKLETDTAFLSTLTVPSGDYTSLNLTFANPELTFRNDSGSALAGCAPGNVCEINPSGPLSSTVNGTFTIASGSQTGLLIDLSLSTLLTQTLGVDFGSAGAVSVSQQTMQSEGELEDADHIDAIISGLSSNQLTLQASNMGNITVAVDTSTQFEGFDTCSARNFSCLQSGQSVEVDLMLLGAGSFLAKKIELQDEVSGDNDEELEGIISKIDSPTQFEIAVIDELSSVANVSVGNPITVMLQTSNGSTSFQVDTDGLNVPSNLQQAFESQVNTSQLLPGQTVQVRAMLVSGGPAPAPITVTADRVRLRVTRFTATVSGTPVGNNFSVGNLPMLFTVDGVNLIEVQTSSQTNFDNVSGISALTDGATVSLRGLLFPSSANPILIADKVRKR